MGRKKRLENWWEPIYAPDTPEFKNHSWKFEFTDSAKNSIFLATSLPDDGSINRFDDITFNCCDFKGDFAAKLANRAIKFNNCVFKSCDFGGTIWKNAFFTKCKFIRTSFTLSTFEECEFRDCSFIEISFSGNRTSIPGTLITNPKSFLYAAKAFLDHLPTDVSARYQEAKLIETQSNLSRILLSNLSKEGSEATYYEAVQASTLLAAKARHIPTLLKAYGSHKKLSWDKVTLKKSILLIWASIYWVSGFCESLIMRFLGLLNGWGGSIFRTLILGLCLLVMFTLVNTWCFNQDYINGFIRAFEVFFLFGYTNYTGGINTSEYERIFLLINAFTGILWYVINVPTVVNKLTRIRG